MAKELDAREDIKAAASDAVKVITAATEAAAKVVANAAAEAVRVVNIKGADDHDLLITMKEQLSRLSEDIRALKDGTAKRIQDLEHDKADKKEFDDLKKEVDAKEVRIRCVEDRTLNYIITFSLFASALTALIGLVVYHILL